MFDVICVPVDGSDYGYHAADVAIEIASKFSSKIAASAVMILKRIAVMRFWLKSQKRQLNMMLKL